MGKLSKSLALGVLFGLVAFWAVGVGAYRPGITGYQGLKARATLEDTIFGRAHKPFVKRQLAPLVVRGSSALVPDSARQALSDAFARSRLISSRLGWPPQYATEYVISLLLMAACALGFLLTLGRLIAATLPDARGQDDLATKDPRGQDARATKDYCATTPLAHLAALATGLLLPGFYAGMTYIYDFPQLLLFTLAALLMYRRQWTAYYVVFALACLNKETSILLPVVMTLWLGRRALQLRWALHIVAQFVVGLAIIAALAWVFRDNPGSGIEWHLDRNIWAGWSKLGWLRLAFLAVLVLLALRRIGRAEPFLRAGLAGTLVPLLVATLFMGYLDELRDYYEALPFLVPLVVLGLTPRRAARANASN